MNAYRESTRCASCGRIIPARDDIIEYKNKFYCPNCYSKKLAAGSSPVGVIMTILGILLFVLVIISWLIW